MTDLREAAERLRQVRSDVPLLDAYPMCRIQPRMRQGQWGVFEQGEYAKACMAVDRENLADAYLDEHPADDDREIDEAWLREIGFEESGGARFRKLLGGDFGIDVYPMLKSGELWCDTRQPYSGSLSEHEVQIKTRRDLRQLLKALGVE